VVCRFYSFGAREMEEMSFDRLIWWLERAKAIVKEQEQSVGS